jgi:type III restriction enzyme
MPEGFAALAEKLGRPLDPPGREVRCIVSVAMLTEGWDCNTVTHVVGLRPFMSQLLCEQVVGRALRRASYQPDDNGLMPEEVAKVFGVPFQIVPFKANPTGPPPPPPKRNHVRSLPERAHLEITFPRVEAYTQAVSNRLTLDWRAVPPLEIDPLQIPPEVEMKGLHPTNEGRLSLLGPGRADEATLAEFRANRRLNELVFEVAATLTRVYRQNPDCDAPAVVLFPQIARIVRRYVEHKVVVHPPGDLKDLFLAPYYGWLVEVLRENLRGDTEAGEPVELPLLEPSRGPGSTAEVDFWTSRDVRETTRSHVNFVVADTKQWEQSAAYQIDTHPLVKCFAKNAGLGLGIPYFHNGEPHEFVPDFLVRLTDRENFTLILETKGYDKLKDVKEAAAIRWCKAVTADGRFGEWEFSMLDSPLKVASALERCRTVAS